jgi:hypothetical protein
MPSYNSLIAFLFYFEPCDVADSANRPLRHPHFSSSIQDFVSIFKLAYDATTTRPEPMGGNA